MAVRRYVATFRARVVMPAVAACIEHLLDAPTPIETAPVDLPSTSGHAADAVG